jgi:cytochrome b involved in lipid metabolism
MMTTAFSLFLVFLSGIVLDVAAFIPTHHSAILLSSRKPSSVLNFPTLAKARFSPSSPLFYGNDGGATNSTVAAPAATGTTLKKRPEDRFQREASQRQAIDQDCILLIHGKKYNMTAWANSHPGGSKILLKFHNKDASKAFEAAHHSAEAYAMLKDFCIDNDNTEVVLLEDTKIVPSPSSDVTGRPLKKNWRVRQKLFTKEDPIGVHKYLGLFCLLNFIGRYTQMFFFDPAAGLGSQGHPWFSMACLIPHAMLSLTSLIFHTVPKERVVGKPMIWQEFRVHNIIFGVRSVLTALASSVAIRAHNTPTVRTIGVAFCGACVLAANWGADKATEKLRVVEVESTTATMP